jgi:hypothetical protein
MARLHRELPKNATGSSSFADPDHALDQCRGDVRHDRQRLEDLQ